LNITEAKKRKFLYRNFVGKIGLDFVGIFGENLACPADEVVLEIAGD
jgi:hypothetical protein